MSICLLSLRMFRAQIHSLLYRNVADCLLFIYVDGLIDWCCDKCDYRVSGGGLIDWSWLYYMLVIIFNMFREIPSTSLMSMAVKRVEEQKMAVFTSVQSILCPQPTKISWGENRSLAKSRIMNQVCGRSHMTGRGDVAYMEQYLSNVARDGINDVGLTDWSDFMVAEAPLLEFLSLDLERIGAWKFPPAVVVDGFKRVRAPGYYMLNEVEVKEIIVGVTPGEDVFLIHQWLKEMVQRNERQFPVNVISMDVESVQSTLFDLLSIVGELPISEGQLMNSRPVSAVRAGHSDKSQQIPVKVMLGDGISWALMISLDLGRSVKRYELRRNVVQTELIDLLEDLPVCVGLGVRTDVRDVEEVFSMLHGRDVKLRGYIDLGVLATLCGWQLYARGMTTMGVQVMGVVLNKCVSTGDGLWGVPWGKLPDALKVYALSDLKFGFMTYVVLSAVLLRDLFPDPEVFCHFGQCYQLDVIRWFLRMVVESLSGLEVHPAAVKQAVSRADLVRCIRTRVGSSKLSSGHPPQMQMFLEMLGQWPSITCGGCRFLIQARMWFCEQMEVLVRYGVGAGCDLLIRKVNEGDRKYAVYGVSMAILSKVMWSQGSVSTRLEFSRPVELTHCLISVTVDQLNGQKLTSFCVAANRSQREMVNEWARMNLQEVTKFFDRLMVDTVFKRWYKSYYDMLRLVYQRATNDFSVTLPAFEEEQDKLNDALLDQEVVKLNRALEEVRSRERRVEWIRDAQARGDAIERGMWRQELPSLLGCRVRNKASKRPGSRSPSPVRRSGSRFRGQYQVNMVMGDSVPGPSGLQSSRTVIRSCSSQFFDGSDSSPEREPVFIRSVVERGATSTCGYTGFSGSMGVTAGLSKSMMKRVDARIAPKGRSKGGVTEKRRVCVMVQPGTSVQEDVCSGDELSLRPLDEEIAEFQEFLEK